jgi:hypothetical protein
MKLKSAAMKVKDLISLRNPEKTTDVTLKSKHRCPKIPTIVLYIPLSYQSEVIINYLNF